MPPKHYLTSNFRVAFEEYFKPDQQRNAVDVLTDHIAEVRDGSEEQRRELGVLRPQDTSPEQIEQRIAAYLDKCYWQLSQFYRVRSVPQPGLLPPSRARTNSRAKSDTRLAVLRPVPHRRSRTVPPRGYRLREDEGREDGRNARALPRGRDPRETGEGAGGSVPLRRRVRRLRR